MYMQMPAKKCNFIYRISKKIHILYSVHKIKVDVKK